MSDSSPYSQGTPLDTILQDGYYRGWDPDFVVEVAKDLGYQIDPDDVLDSWSAFLDKEMSDLNEVRARLMQLYPPETRARRCIKVLMVVAWLLGVALLIMKYEGSPKWASLLFIWIAVTGPYMFRTLLRIWVKSYIRRALDTASRPRDGAI